jgi:hypothetical protein
MADTKITGIINLQTNSNEVSNELRGTEQALNNVSTATNTATASTNQNSQAITDNGGAVALLNAVTGGLASTVKDTIEATQLLTKNTSLAAAGNKIASIAQAGYTFVVGTSTGAMKLFRIALASTGIGLLVIGLGLLIANFDKVKEVVLNLFPGLKGISSLIGGIVDSVTDFVGATSAAERAVEKLNKTADESLARNKKFLAEQGDTLNEFQKARIDAENAYSEALKEEGSNQEALAKRLSREILKINADEQNQRDEGRKKEQDKVDAANKIAADKRKSNNEKIAAERAKLEAERVALETKLADELENLQANTEQKKLDLEKERQIESINLTIEAGTRRNAALELLDSQFKIKQDALNQTVADKEVENENKRVELRKSAIETIQDLEDVSEQAKLDRQKERDLAEIEALDIQESTKIILKNSKDEEFRIRQSQLNQKTAEEEKQLDQDVNTAKIQLASNAAQAIGDIASLFLGSSEKDAKKAFDIDKGLKLAQATMAGIEGTQNAYTTAQKSPITALFPAYPIVQAASAGVFSAIKVAAIAKTKFKGGASGASGGGGGASGGGGSSAPSFNVVGTSGTNQLAETVAGQNAKPIVAQVVSTQMSTQQGLDRDKAKNATFI